MKMKKLLTLAAFMLSVMGMNADPITPARALQIAQEYMVVGHPMTMKVKAKARQASTVSAPYYVISRGENQGYVIVAGDDCLPEVLGFTEYGDFDESNIPPALQEMLDVWQANVEAAQADGSNVERAKARKAQRRASGNRVNIAPFVTSHWHQTSPYNDNGPLRTDNGNHVMTGCVATAASQILYYWRKDLPATLQASTPTYGYGGAPVTRSVPKGTPMKWDLMKDSYGSETTEYKQEVAEFVFAVGAATWLTFGYQGGDATAGDMVNIPYTYSQYFGMNGGTVHYRDSYSQEGWTQLLYKELAEGRPVMYTGVKGENDGHAVFVHGYRASDDMFYFNFGWGGQSDGYYTTTQETGMNGFNNYQAALIGAYPKKWNIDATILPAAHVYLNVEHEYTVRIENHSTLDFSGVYLFASTSTSKPSKLANAKSSDTKTVIAKGEVKELPLTAKLTSDKVWYITVTDQNLNVLGSITVTPEEHQTNLRFEGLTLAGSSETETFEGEEYQVVYHEKTTASATIANLSSAAYEGNQRMYFYVYDELTKEWSEVGYKQAKLTVDGNATADVSFNISNTSSCPFEKDKYYKGVLSDEIPSSEDKLDYGGRTDTQVRFILKGGDMEVVSFEEGCLTLKGHFDNTAFNSSTFSTKTAYKTATVYDLTQCTSIGAVSQSINPNALIYVADDSEATGVNVVKAGKCAHLSLTPGYNFTPRADFVAEKAQINLQAVPALWCLLTAPFAAVVPDGMVAREVSSHTSSGIFNRTADVRTLEAGKTYLLMSSSAENMVLTGENVTVVAAPVENADPAVVGTYTNMVTPAGAQLLDSEEKQSFVPVDEGTAVEALRGYWYASDLTKSFKAYSDISLDPTYTTLAQTIDEAYQILAKYKEVTTASAYAAYLAEIQEAEVLFSNRTEKATVVKKYAEQLLADGSTYMKQITNVGNMEIDFTSSIVNPSFEESKTSAKGWTVGKIEGSTTAGGSVYDGTAFDNNRAVGLDGTYIFQSFIKPDSISVSISQVVEGLTPGYYRLTAMLGTDEASTVTLFAGDATATVQGHEFGHLYLTKAVINDIEVKADEGSTTGSLTIGVKDGRWYKADDFTLTYVSSFTNPDDQPDAIIEVNAGKTTTQKGIYTLQGVRLSKTVQSGIYIIDGKKTLVP